MSVLSFSLDRAILAPTMPATVLAFLTDSARWAKWWGPGSTIDPVVGGKVYIRHGNGIESLGEVLEVCENERIVFTYGFASGRPIAPGASTVTVRLAPAQGRRAPVPRHRYR